MSDIRLNMNYKEEILTVPQHIHLENMIIWSLIHIFVMLMAQQM